MMHAWIIDNGNEELGNEELALIKILRIQDRKINFKLDWPYTKLALLLGKLVQFLIIIFIDHTYVYSLYTVGARY